MDIETAREEWRTTIEHDGGHCPVCNRWGKINKHCLGMVKARSLIWLCATSTDEEGWVDVPNIAPIDVLRTNQLATLHLWGLVERREKRSGFWRPTALGFDFVHAGARVPRKVFVYNNRVEAHSPDTVAIQDCFKEQFDYQQMMNTYFSGN